MQELQFENISKDPLLKHPPFNKMIKDIKSIPLESNPHEASSSAIQLNNRLKPKQLNLKTNWKHNNLVKN
jgi:hypothetical protein